MVSKIPHLNFSNYFPNASCDIYSNCICPCRKFRSHNNKVDYKIEKGKHQENNVFSLRLVQGTFAFSSAINCLSHCL